MIIYVALFLLTLFMVVHFDIYNDGKRGKVGYIFLCITFILAAGLRYRVGADSIHYMDFYQQEPPVIDLLNINLQSERYDILWVLLWKVCRFITSDFLLLQFIHAIFVNSVVFFFFWKYSPKPFWAVLWYLLLGFIYMNTEIMRESVAICIFMLSYGFFRQKRWIYYYLFALLAVGFHSSAYIVFVFPFLYNIKLNSRFFALILIGVAIFSSFWIIFKTNIELFYFLSDTIEGKSSYIDNERFMFSVNGLILSIIQSVLIPFFVVIYFFKKKININNEAPLVFVYVFLGILVVYNNVIFSRFSNYVFLFYILLLSKYFFCLLEKKKFYFVFFFSIVVISVNYYKYFKNEEGYSNIYLYERYIPYSSVFTETKYKHREFIGN